MADTTMHHPCFDSEAWTGRKPWQPKSETALKLAMLTLCRGDLKGWYRSVWKQNGGERLCCNGYMCGCYGADHWSYWEHLLGIAPPAPKEMPYPVLTP